MKKMTITIALCTTLFLVACGQTGDTESSNPTSSTDSMSEQDAATLTEQQTIPAEQSVDSSMGAPDQSEQAAFEESDNSEATQGTQQ